MITVQLVDGGPITEMDEAALHRTDGQYEDENEITKWVEYRLNIGDERAIHRSVHVHLKKPMVFSDVAAGGFVG